MDSNFIKVLPGWLFTHLTQIRILNISNNLVYSIPPEIRAWKSTLTHLDLSINRIEDICEEICELSSLVYLLLNQNDFKYIPLKLYKLARLKTLNLDWFKYLAPPRPEFLQGKEGEKDILILQNALNHIHMKGYTTAELPELPAALRKDYLHFAQFVK